VKKHAGGVVQNPHDPEATWCAKGKAKAKKEWIGYKVQVAESLGPPRTQKSEPTHNFLTSVVTQAATESDDAGMKAALEAQAQMGLEKPTELLVDAGYISAEAIVEAQAQGRELVGPARPSPQAAKGTGTESFDICIQERRAICPAGCVNTQCSRLEEKASGKVTYRFEWSTHCRQCALRAKCVGKGQPHRSLVVGEHHTELQTRRHEQKSEAFARRMQERNGIEGTQSEMVRAHGLRKARYRGKAKDDLQNQLIGAACNIKRWLRLVAWELRVAAIAAAAALKAKAAFAS
jgi:transposase